MSTDRLWWSFNREYVLNIDFLADSETVESTFCTFLNHKVTIRSQLGPIELFLSSAVDLTSTVLSGKDVVVVRSDYSLFKRGSNHDFGSWSSNVWKILQSITCSMASFSTYSDMMGFVRTKIGASRRSL